MRALPPSRGAAQAAQDHHLPALRPATTKRRARPVQPLHPRRPGAPGPIRRIPGCTAAIDPAVVEPAGRVRDRPLPPQRVGGRPARDRPALVAQPNLSPHQLRRAAGAPINATTERVLTAFFTSQGLTLARSEGPERAARKRQRYLEAIPDPLGRAVAQYNKVQTGEQDRRTRTGRRILSDITLATRLRILRDLAADVCATRPVTGWAEVTTDDLERFLARCPAARHQQTYVLRRFFAWARGHRLVLVNPARALVLGAQPAFTGSVLDLATQRALFRRWTRETTPTQERLVGLLALLHAATNAQIRALTIADIDQARQALTLKGRPAPAPMDPTTWAAIQACRREREATGSLNPHLIISRTTRSRDTPVHTTYLPRLLAPSGTSPALCRQTRLTQLVTDLDPKLTATVLGMQDTGLVRYLADNVDRDRLQPTAPPER